MSDSTRDPSISLRCPACRQQGIFQPISPDVHNGEPTAMVSRRVVGLRRCPGSDCHAVVFVAFGQSNQLLGSLPSELIDFDATDLPANVLASLSEAVLCASQECWRAAAIMVRRTLEDVCADRGATGGSLVARLSDLAGKVILPTELLDGLQSLRLLGNDAAHIEATTYNQVGKQEVSVAIDVAKEVLKAVYQYRSLIDRLNALKQPVADDPDS